MSPFRILQCQNSVGRPPGQTRKETDKTLVFTGALDYHLKLHKEALCFVLENGGDGDDGVGDDEMKMNQAICAT